MRKGDVGLNDPNAERLYDTRNEDEWPITRTKYAKFHLAPNKTLSQDRNTDVGEISYPALDHVNEQQFVQFANAPFEEEKEITGHAAAHLNVSLTRDLTDRPLLTSTFSNPPIHWTGY